MPWFLLCKLLFGSKCALTKPAYREDECLEYDENGVNDESLELGDLQPVASQADVNEVDAPMKRPIAYFLISIWGILETVLLIIVMFMINKQVPPKFTFMAGRCLDNDKESHRMANSEMIIYKIVTSTLLVIGGKSVSKNFTSARNINFSARKRK